MFDVNEIIRLHAQWVGRWHVEPTFDDESSGFLGLVCQQHRYNFELWHQEDAARNPTASAEQIAQVKRAIDRLNQNRNDWVEKLDDWLTDELQRLGISASPTVPLNTETPGSAIDRLSILSLRIYHYREQLECRDANESVIPMVQRRIALCEEQLGDLSRSLQDLVGDIRAGIRRHKTYRQMKMYNDPLLRQR